MSSKLSEQNRRYYYITLITFFCLTLISLCTNFLSVYKNFLIGVFGLVIYPIIILSICFCILKLMNKSFSLDKKSLLYCFAIFTIFLCILQMALTRGFEFSSYSEYLSNVYNSNVTPGGVIIGVLVFPVRYVTHEIATYIIYSIILVIIVACAIDNYYSKMARLRGRKPILQRKTNVSGLSTVLEPQKQDEEKELTNSEGENKFFAIDDSDITPLIDEEETTDAEEDAKKAKKLLGLVDKDKTPYEVLFGDDTKEQALKKLYPEKNNNEDEIVQNNYLQENLGKYMPEKPIFENGNKEPNFKLQDLQIGAKDEKISSEEYLNRTMPKTLQSGTIIRGDFFQNDKDAVEIVGNTKNFEIEDIIDNDEIDDDEENVNRIDIDYDGFYVGKDENEDEDAINNLNEVKINHEINITASEEQPQIDIENLIDVNLIDKETNQHEAEINCINAIEESEERERNQANTPPQVVQQKKKHKPYVKPPVDLLTVESTDMSNIASDTVNKSRILEETLKNFKIPAKVQKVIVGPSITMYEMTMPVGVSVKSINKYADDIAMSLQSKGNIRIQAPIPGENAVGIETPNENQAQVGLKEVFENGMFKGNEKNPLSFVLGKDILGTYKFCDLAKAPHILISGSTGSGKSVCLNILILSILYKCSPDDVKLILVDPKRVEFAIYEGLPHLMLPSIITEPEKAVNALSWAVNEMEKRYRTLQQNKVRDIGEYNSLEDVKKGKLEKMAYIVLIVDELADLMSVAKRDIENNIQRLTAKARSAGIHLVLATQRPSIDVVTGTIKNNLPTRIAFSLASSNDSKTVLGQGGAEKLLGKGDMLYSANGKAPNRYQSPYVSTEEVKSIVSFIKENNETDYDEGIQNIIYASQENQQEQASKPFVGRKDVAEDEYFARALKMFIETQQVSTSMIQRRLRLGFNRSASLVDEMEKRGYITKPEKNKRKVLISMEKFIEIFGDDVEDV